MKQATELLKKVAQPRVSVRLDHGDDPAFGDRPRRGQHARNLGRVVTVIVDHPHPADDAGGGEAPPNATKRRQPRSYLVDRDAEFAADREGGQGVEDIVASPVRGWRNGPNRTVFAVRVGKPDIEGGMLSPARRISHVAPRESPHPEG